MSAAQAGMSLTCLNSAALQPTLIISTQPARYCSELVETDRIDTINYTTLLFFIVSQGHMCLLPLGKIKLGAENQVSSRISEKKKKNKAGGGRLYDRRRFRNAKRACVPVGG